MPNIRYSHARDVEDVAEKILAEVEAHSPLRNVDIHYLFRDRAAQVRGEIMLGTTRKVSGVNAARVALVGRDEAEAPEFFEIEIAHDQWLSLKAPQRIALVDHLLSFCHIEYPEDSDRERTLKLVGPDVVEFTGVLERRGAWRPSLERMQAVAGELPGQQALDAGEDNPDDNPAGNPPADPEQ
jgi:hypothetical protein